MVTSLGPSQAILAATICRRHYVDGEPKSQIAASTGLSRFQVARLLEWSIETGIIRFEISVPGGFDVARSEAVRKRFGLKRAVVVDVPESELDPRNVRERVGEAAGSLLSEIVSESDILGIGWGRTLGPMAASLTRLARCTVVQMGGMIGSVHENSLEVVRQVSSVNHGRAYPLYVPLILEDRTAAESMRRQPGIAAAVRLFDSITVGAVAVGSWDPPDSQVVANLTPEEQARLEPERIVGEVCTTLFRQDGSVAPGFEDRSIAVSAAQLRRIRDLVLIAGGRQKARAVRAALAGGFGNMLVTDRSLADELLENGVGALD